MRLVRLAWPILLALVAFRPVWGQGMPGASQRPAELSGLVVDSLHGKPLAGATVLIEGTTTTTRTDAAGRFTFGDVSPGFYRLSAYHPVLDTLGLTIATWPMRVGPGEARSVMLQIPTARAIVTRNCLATQRRLGPTAIIGRVTVPDTLVAVDGIVVSFSWTAGASVAGDTMPPMRSTTTGANGMYVLCGLPARTHGTVRVGRPEGVSIEFPLTTGDAVLEVQRPVVLP